MASYLPHACATMESWHTHLWLDAGQHMCLLYSTIRNSYTVRDGKSRITSVSCQSIRRDLYYLLMSWLKGLKIRPRGTI